MNLKTWLSQEYSTGVILFCTVVLALVAANTSLAPLYDSLLTTQVSVTVDGKGIDKPLLLWINDGLMAIFFLYVSLEVKHEMVSGELSDPRKVALPGVAAIGGMFVPAAVYLAVAWGDETLVRGWAIPAATDIVFALGVLAFVGTRVPVSLKVFLLALAVLDDLGAIVIIAAFYTSSIAAFPLVAALVAVAALVLMNRNNVRSAAGYVLVGIVAWFFVLKSGVHATLAGVALGFAIPTVAQDGQPSLAHKFEHDLKPVVNFFILPIFAFANAGLDLRSISLEQVLSPLTVAIAMGLFIGKQIGVMGFAFLAVKMGWASLPRGANWLHMYGIACLTGIGFTMSLFIASLAFPENSSQGIADYRLGILIGSFIAGLLGYLVLRYASALLSGPAKSE